MKHFLSKNLLAAFVVILSFTLAYNAKCQTYTVSIQLYALHNQAGNSIELFMNQNNSNYVSIPNTTNFIDGTLYGLSYDFNSSDSSGTVSLFFINCCGDTVYTPDYSYNATSSLITDTFDYCSYEPCALDTLTISGTLLNTGGAQITVYLWLGIQEGSPTGLPAPLFDSLVTDFNGNFSVTYEISVIDFPLAVDFLIDDCNGSSIGGGIEAYDVDRIYYIGDYCDTQICDFGPTIFLINDPECGQSNGSIDIINESVNYSYLWSNSAITPDINNIDPGVYSLTVTNNNNSCTASYAVMVGNCCTNSPTITATTTNPTCNTTTGAIDIIVTGGVAPYVYTWTNGATNQNLSNLAAGIYCITVTDANGCTGSGCFTLTDLAAPTVSGVVTPGFFNTWDIDVTVTGTAPFSYVWDNSVNTEDLISVTSGTYCLTVTDANGCSAQTCFTAGVSITIYGQLNNTNGDIIPVNITIDSVTTNTVWTSPVGAFAYTFLAGSTQSSIDINFVDCNNILQDTTLYVGGGTTTVFYTDDFCALVAAQMVNIIGELANPDVAVDVTITTDSISIVTTAVFGLFDETVPVINPLNPINISFTDCNGNLFDTAIYTNSTLYYFYADYCSTIIDSSCSATYTAEYCTCDTFMLELDSITQAQGGTYFWDFGDGSTSTEQFPYHTYTVDAIYNVCLTHTTANGITCSYCHEIGIDSLGNIVLRMDADGFVINVVPYGTTGIKEILPNESFEIYPNPVGNNGLVSLYSDQSTTYTINIYNSIGQHMKVFNVNVNAGRNDIRLPLHDLADGLYMMNIKFESKSISRSFVK